MGAAPYHVVLTPHTDSLLTTQRKPDNPRIHTSTYPIAPTPPFDTIAFVANTVYLSGANALIWGGIFLPIMAFFSRDESL